MSVSRTKDERDVHDHGEHARGDAAWLMFFVHWLLAGLASSPTFLI